MQRVRIGLTGLALVFLFVLLGFVVRSLTDEESASANFSTQSSDPAASLNSQEPAEPLAQLGIAPGNADSDNASTSTPKN